jgi:plasmid maintenance system antidote protein VapI
MKTKQTKVKKQDDDLIKKLKLMKKLKQLPGDMRPGQVFKKYFVQRLTPDPVEMEIDPPTQLFNDIIEGKLKITFEVGMRLSRYFGPQALGLVDYQDFYDTDRALGHRQFKRLWAKLRRQTRAKPRSKR